MGCSRRWPRHRRATRRERHSNCGERAAPLLALRCTALQRCRRPFLPRPAECRTLASNAPLPDLLAPPVQHERGHRVRKCPHRRGERSEGTAEVCLHRGPCAASRRSLLRACLSCSLSAEKRHLRQLYRSCGPAAHPCIGMRCTLHTMVSRAAWPPSFVTRSEHSCPRPCVRLSRFRVSGGRQLPVAVVELASMLDGAKQGIWHPGERPARPSAASVPCALPCSFAGPCQSDGRPRRRALLCGIEHRCIARGKGRAHPGGGRGRSQSVRSSSKRL
jgi:hypothetical protein